MPPTQDRTFVAAGAILIYAFVIGFTDNFVRVIAAEGGLWQFHAIRGAMALSLLGVASMIPGVRLRPRNARAVAARSAIHGVSMLIYFGSLAFLPVAQVAAGLFTAPIFVLLISGLVYGHRIGPLHIVAVLAGFLGVILVLGPDAIGSANLAGLLPVVAGALYALGNIATREWCAAETAETLLAGFFAALMVLGLAGIGVLALHPIPVPEAAAGFVQRGWTTPSATFLFWTFVQAAGSLFAVGMMIRAYKMADAGKVSVFEYTILPASAFWGWVLWQEVLTPLAVAGMILIAVAGGMIALGPRYHRSPTASRQ